MAPTTTHARRRSPRLALALALTGVLALTPVLIGSAAHAADATDYEQVVDITFPIEAAVEVSFRDDYDDPRSSTRHHQATDLMVAGGTAVHAAVGGTVSWTSGSADGPPSYGWMVRIAGDDGRTYAYVHLGWQDRPASEAYAPGIERGARVERGQLLGWAGCSGSASCGGGEHLHFEIHDDRVQDPYDYHDHERINPYRSLVAARERGDFPGVSRRFLDVPLSATHHDSIIALADSGITRGCSTSRFCPQDPVSRQQMATFLTRVLTDVLERPVPDATPTFADVPATSVHAANISTLAAFGVTKGCGDDQFCPRDPVTRQQMATFLARALELPAGEPVAFDDVTATNVHADSISKLARSGITQGCAPDRFCPDQPVTRQQMATFLRRALDL